MKKTILLLALTAFLGTVSGLNFPEDPTVQGEVNSSPPMPGENFTAQNNLSEDGNSSSQASDSSEEDLEEAFEDEDESGFLSNLIDWLIGLIPFL